MIAEDYYRLDCIKHDLLTADQEIDLIRCAQSGDRQSLETLVRCNQRMVYKVAMRYLYSAGDQELCDLIQWGNLGMLTAIRKFDLSRCLRFATYAYWWILQSIRRNAGMFGSRLTLSNNVIEKARKIRKYRVRLYQDKGREPTDHEIHEATGISMQRIRQVKMATVNVMSLEKTINTPSSDGSEFIEILPVEPGAEIGAETRLMIERAMDCLTERQKQVIKFIYFDGLTRNQVGQHFKLTHERIRQIEKQSLSAMRNKLGSVS